MSRARPVRILTFASVRKTLTTVAQVASHMEAQEFDDYVDTLVEELQALRRREATADVWRQATQASVQGHEAYGLERIGLWPPAPTPPPKAKGETRAES